LRLTPNFLNWIEGWQIDAAAVMAVPVLAEAVEDRKFAAGHEGRGFSGNSSQVRLREGVNDSSLLHGLNGGADVLPSAGDGGSPERLAARRERIGVVEIDHRGAVAERAGEVDAELLDDVALDLGDGHLEYDLVAAADDDGVDDFAAERDGIGGAGAKQPHRDVVGLLRLGLARCGAAENDAFAADVGIRQDLPDCRADAVEIACHRNVEAGHLPAFGIEEKTLVWPTPLPTM
jgi:hypothetical protein